jgi:dolichol-phosphate mannosyltransferase
MITNKNKKFISAVAYAHNSERKIDNFLKMLHGVLAENFEEFEIICVNDYSSDNSKERIRQVAKELPNCMISVVNTGFYQGVEVAMLAGIDLAIGDFVFEFDDVTVDYEPGLIMECFNRCIHGYDIVSCGIGSRRASSRLFYSIFNRYSGTQHEIKSETFRVVSRRAINRVYSISPNPIYRKALYHNCGLKTDYVVYKGVGPKQRSNLKNPHDTAITSLLLFTGIAYKATLVFAFIMMLATLASVAYVIAIYIIGSPIEGYTTMMILISGAFFALFAILAVVIKYLSVLLQLVFQRQKYVLESVEKL